MRKSELRKVFRNKRDQLSHDEVLLRSKKVCDNFLQNLLPKIYDKDKKIIFSIYLESGKEVSTKDIAEFFKKNHIAFSYPQIVRKNRYLDFVLFDKDLVFTRSKFYRNILEPNGQKKVLPDFLIVPLLAFDSNLNRLGMGGGFFDRTIEFLKRKKTQITTIGLAFDFQGQNLPIPTNDTDCALDFIVTEKNVFSSNHI